MAGKALMIARGALLKPPTTCDACGACCRHMVAPPFLGVDDPEFAALPEALRWEFDAFYANVRDTLPEDFPCYWLDLATMRCRHYDERPRVCRDFEIGSEACLQWRWSAATDGLREQGAE